MDFEIMDDELRETLREVVREEAEAGFTYDQDFVARINGALDAIPNGTEIVHTLTEAEQDALEDEKDAPDLDLIANTIDFHYGNI